MSTLDEAAIRGAVQEVHAAVDYEISRNLTDGDQHTSATWPPTSSATSTGSSGSASPPR